MHESRYIESTRFRFQDERLLKVCKFRHNFFSSLDRDFKTNLDTEYLKFLENLKCKLGNKKLWCDQNQTLPPPPNKN